VARRVADRLHGVPPRARQDGEAAVRPHDLPRLEHFAALPCGTRAKYVAGACRCVRCRAANSRYETERRARRLAGEGDPLVSAAPARAHLERLSRAGVGRRVVAAACDVSLSVLAAVKQRRKHQIRRSTEQRILAVDATACAAGTLVDGRPTWRRIAELVEEGFSQAEIARRLGLANGALQFRRDRVTAPTAARVERFYRLVMAEAPHEPARRRRAAAA
jgi:hypothetical protein